FNALNITQIMRDRGDQAFGVRSFPAATVRAVMEGCGCCTFGDSNGLIVATVSNGSTGTTRLVTIVVVTIIAITSGRSHRMGSFTAVGIGSHAASAGDITQSVTFHILLAGAQAAVSGHSVAMTFDQSVQAVVTETFLQILARGITDIRTLVPARSQVADNIPVIAHILDRKNTSGLCLLMKQ